MAGLDDAFGPPDVPGGYQLLECLGRGEFGEVWRAAAPGGVEVAVKLIHRTVRREEADRELAALQVIKRLRHPYLLSLQAFFALPDRLVIVMELADRSLRQRLNECRRAGQDGLPPGELRDCIREAAEALDYLHAHNVQHRDVKPANLLLLGGHVKVADYGLARLLDTPSLQMASSVGTPVYMAPEVWMGQVGVHSDQYSLAVACVELRLGRPPFPTDNLAKLMRGHVYDRPELSTLPVAEQEVLHRALAKSPRERYPTCSAFAAALAEALPRSPDETGAPVVGGDSEDSSARGSEVLFVPAEVAPEPVADAPPGGPEEAVPPVPADTAPEPMPDESLRVPAAVGEPPTTELPAAEVPSTLTPQPMQDWREESDSAVPTAFLPEAAPPPSQDWRGEPDSAVAPVFLPEAAPGSSQDWRGEEPPARRRRLLPWVVASLLAACVAIVAWQLGPLFESQPKSEVAVGSAPPTPPREPVKPLPEVPRPRDDHPPAKEPQPEQLPAPKEQPPPVPPRLHLAAVGPVLLNAGERRALEVRVRRENCDGPVRVVLSGLPAGASAPAVRLAPGQDTVRIDLKADGDADDAMADVTLRAELDALRAEGTFRVSIRGRPALRLLPVADVTVHAGQVRSFGVRVQRRRCPGPVELRLEGLPPGVTAWRGLVTADRDTGGLTVTVGEGAGLAVRKVRVVAAGAGLRAEAAFRFTVGVRHSPEERLAEDSRAIARAPKDPIAWQNRGHTYRELGEYGKAIADYSEAISLDPFPAPAHVGRANAHLGARDYTRAIDDFRRAAVLAPDITDKPHHALAYRSRGDTHFEQREYADAIADYTAALDLNPDAPLAWTNRGNAYRDTDDLKRAVADYARAIRLDRNFTLAYRNRALAWNRHGKYDWAIDDLTRAISLDPNNPRPYHARGFAHAKKEDYERAIRDFTEAILRDPENPAARRDRGEAYLKTRQFDKALADFDTAINLNPTDPALHNSRGAAWYLKKDYPRAIEDYTRATDLDRNYALAYENRALAYAARRDEGDAERATTDRERAARLKAARKLD